MDPTRDVIQVNPSAGSWDRVPSTLGIWGIFNIPLKDIPIQSRWLPKLFTTAKIYHVRATWAVVASKHRHSVRTAGGGQASSGAIPPIVTRVGKEVDTLDGGHDDFKGGLGVGGEPLLM